MVDRLASSVTDSSYAVGRDRATLVTAGLLLVVAAAAWIGVVRQPAGLMEPMDDGTGMAVELSLVAAVAFVAAWSVMMAAMMLPSATPMIALYGAVRRTGPRSARRGIPTAVFALVYLLLWAAVGIPVYLVSSLVQGAAMAEPTIAAVLPYALGLVLVAAGLYQWSPLKRACLRVCRGPLSFLMRGGRTGYAGTLRLALDHAGYCLGCCWALMVVLVAAGAMALQWVLLIAVVVLIEKLLPFGEWTARVVGGGLVLLGLALFLDPGLALVLRGQSVAV
jgi:predicted metal-binding membrane protein